MMLLSICLLRLFLLVGWELAVWAVTMGNTPLTHSAIWSRSWPGTSAMLESTWVRPDIRHTSRGKFEGWPCCWRTGRSPLASPWPHTSSSLYLALQLQWLSSTFLHSWRFYRRRPRRGFRLSCDYRMPNVMNYLPRSQNCFEQNLFHAAKACCRQSMAVYSVWWINWN